MNTLLIGVVVGIVLVAILIIRKVLVDMENDAANLDAEWEDLATRGDMGYYDPSDPPSDD